jgi:hypothetical protein
MTPETEYKIVPYPTDQQRADIKRAAWRQMFAAMSYDVSTRTFTVSELALEAAGIPVMRPTP